MRKEIGIIGMIACIGIGVSLGWAIPALIPEEEPRIETLKIPEEPEEPVVPEEPDEPEVPQPPRVPLLDQIIANGSLTIGTSADYAPFENLTLSGEIVGFDINLSLMIANEINVSLEIVDMSFDMLIGECLVGTFDILVAAAAYTSDRAAILAPSLSYINISQVVIVRNDSGLTSINNLNDLSGSTVGCISGSEEQSELQSVGGITVVPFVSAATLIQDLIGGGTDAVYVTEPIYTAWSQTEALRVIFRQGLQNIVMWCRWEEPELQYVINKVIFKAYQTGAIYNLMKFWFN